MGIYLINLDRSTDRLAHMDAQFRELDIAYERVSAVDGRSLSDRDLKLPGQPMPRGAIGCLLSHQRVWETALHNDDAFAAVFEDDIHIAPKLAAFVSDWSWIPRDADLIKLETMLMSVDVDKDPSAIHCGCAVRRLHSSHWGSAGYIISARLAGRLVERGIQYLKHSDDILFSGEHELTRDCIVYQVDPALCIQDVALSEARGNAVSFESVIVAERHPHEIHPPKVKSIFDKLTTETRSAARLVSRHVGSGRGLVDRKKIPFDAAS